MQKTIPNYIKTYPHLMSIMLHLIVFFSFVFYLDFSSEKVALGIDSIPAVNSYVYQDHASEKIVAVTSQSHSTPAKSVKHEVANKVIQKSISLKKTALASSTSESQSMQSSQLLSPVSHGQQVSELVALLHAAIQKQQHYPASALQLEREGRVKVKFTLDKNGRVSNLQVAESSGTSSLDEAALSAVKDAAPFSDAAQYIHAPQIYSIDVAFELT
jgi:TonB family protein